MICKACGYEANENFHICPSCGGKEIISHQEQYNQNQKNLSQYQTPFTNTNQQNQLNNELVSNTNQDCKIYDSNMSEYFKGFTCSFDINQNEIKMSRNLNGGNFAFWLKFLLILSFFFGSLFPLLFILFSTIAGICNLFILTSLELNSLFADFYLLLSHIILFCGDISSWLYDCITNFPFFIIISGVLFMLFVNYLAIAKITVNSNGIYLKIFFKKYFISKDKIDSIVCRIVTRKKIKYFQETLYDVFIIMKEKDKKLFNTIEIDTGLCYKNKIHVDYLIDMFNERLGFL